MLTTAAACRGVHEWAEDIKRRNTVLQAQLDELRAADAGNLNGRNSMAPCEQHMKQITDDITALRMSISLALDELREVEESVWEMDKAFTECEEELEFHQGEYECDC